MVQFGRNRNAGTILQAGTFLAEELPIRLAHRVKELDELPNGLNKMPSIVRVKDWYAQSFEELLAFPKPRLPKSIASKFPSNPSNSPSALPHEQQSQDAAEGSSSKGLAIEGATTNPVFDERAKFEDGAEDGEVAGRGVASSSKNGNGNGGSGGEVASRKRVPLANR